MREKITLTQQLKNIRFRCSDLYFRRLQTYKDGIRNATLSKTKSGNYFLSILVELPQEEVIKFKQTNERVGIDLGVKNFAITSDGEVFENKHFFSTQEKKIAKLQRQLSRKRKGSKNRDKQRMKIAKAFEHLTNQKEVYIHSVVNELLTYYDTVFMEDLNVRGMLKNHKLAKAIAEVGFYKFKQVLTDKAFNNGKRVILVDRFYPSSKTCSKCGYKNKGLTLNDREWTCPVCGTHHDRDLNAAMNILMEGERIIGSRTANLRLWTIQLWMNVVYHLKSSDRLKQEINSDKVRFYQNFYTVNGFTWMDDETMLLRCRDEMSQKPKFLIKDYSQWLQKKKH